MSIGTFTLIRNEAKWIAPHILRVIPFIDEMVFFDGNSTDGTIEIIEAIKADIPYVQARKIKLYKNKDPKNLQDDYVRLSNECMRELSTDFSWFLHPDMWVVNPERILQIDHNAAVALSTSVRSFGGEPGGELFEMDGRGTEWKHIYRLLNPDLGAHYFGHYGETREDVYFSEITGDQHIFYDRFENYPYSIAKSGIGIMHFSDVRTFARREQRMMRCLLNNKWPLETAKARAAVHPRVTLKDGEKFKFTPAKYPGEFLAHQFQYQHLVKEPQLVQA